MNAFKVLKQGARPNAALEDAIDQLAARRYGDDPRVTGAKQKLQEFETRAGSLATQIESMASQHIDLEKESASAMLAGTDPKLSRLTTLVSRKVDAETELRLLASVIEQARTKVTEITEQAAHEQDLQELEGATTAIDQYVDAFGIFLEVQAVLEKALNLHALTPFTSLRRSLPETRDVYEEVLKYKQLILQVSKETRQQ
jgi:hypothetical protein